MLNKTPKAVAEKTVSAPRASAKKRIMIVVGLLLLCLAAGGMYLIKMPRYATGQYECGGGGQELGMCGLKLLVVRSQAAREKGLGGVELPKNVDGMLFVFPREEQYGIWMKNMHYNINIYWLDAGKRIVDQKENVSPSTYPQVFTPKKPARFVVEIPSSSRAYLMPDTENGDAVSLDIH